MISEQKIGVAGYIIRRTAQIHSLRETHSQISQELKNKNMILYIHKKVSTVRKKLGNDKQQQKYFEKVDEQKKEFATAIINGEITGVELFKIANHDNDFSELGRQILKAIEYTKYHDDFYLESGGVPQKKKKVNEIFKITSEQKLKDAIIQNIDKCQTMVLFQQFQKEKLKDKIKLYSTSDVDVLINKLLEVRNEKQIDPRQDAFLMQQVCEPNKITVGSVLHLKENKIPYKLHDKEFDEFAEQRKQGKMTALEQINDLIEGDEQRQKQQIIEQYKKSKMDEADPLLQANKNKRFKMLVFKKQTQMQDKIQQQQLQNDRTFYMRIFKDPEVDPEKFVRAKKRYNGPKDDVNVFQRLQVQTPSIKSLQSPSNTAASGFNSPQNSVSVYSNKTALASQVKPIVPMIDEEPKPKLRLAKMKSSLSQINLLPDEASSPSKVSQQNARIMFRSRPSMAQIDLIKELPILQEIHSQSELQGLIDKYQKQGNKKLVRRLKNMSCNIKLKQKFDNFINRCDDDIQNKVESNNIQQNLQAMDEMIDKNIDNIVQQAEILRQKAPLDKQFMQFKQEKGFKRRLVQHLLNKVQNPSYIYSQYFDHKNNQITKALQ